MNQVTLPRLFASLRLALGFLLLWAFVDKLFGFGFSTAADKSWLDGGSPTAGFLTHATYGPGAPAFQALAGSALVDWLFMLGLLGLGLALVLGIALKLTRYTGTAMFALMYLSMFPPKQNPLIDEHIIFIICLQLFPLVGAGSTWGFGRSWASCSLVKKFPLLA